MRCLESLMLPSDTVSNPHIYPYNVFRRKRGECLRFDRVTVLYGGNGSGKSTVLNLLACLLGLPGGERPQSCYWQTFMDCCRLTYGDGASGGKLPDGSRYLKSEDILYEIKKVQQEAVLSEGYRYERARLGETRKEWLTFAQSPEYGRRMEILEFAQEKYSNGETTMQVFEDYLRPGALLLLDEPEVSLSPDNQLRLAETVNRLARLEDCQFIVATHSPFLLGTLEARLYDLGRDMLEPCCWTELSAMRTFYDFFRAHEHVFAES